ncbi:MAG: AAA family ATPase [Deltaproteobacteria bacterium]|nr:AAA family ATPase [Deltaproteobacteria bacterium]
MSDDETKREILRELLAEVRAKGAYPQRHAFDYAHKADRHLLEELVGSGLVDAPVGRYSLTLEGLRACETLEARQEVDAAAALIPSLQAEYGDRGGPVTATALAQRSGKTETEVKRALSVLRFLPSCGSYFWENETGLVDRGQLDARVLGVSPSDVAPPIEDPVVGTGEEAKPDRHLTKIEIDGYRPFREFVAEPGDLTVIIGANATGKSSLFDFLRFIRRAATDPLPPEIDERSAGMALFHAGRPERVAFAVTLDLGQRVPVRYEAEILGPIGAPRVARERLATTKPLRDDEVQPFLFLDFTGGRGVVRDQRERKLVRPEWTVKSNELALRRALDPTLVTLSRAQALLSSWRFYSGFDVSSSAAIRRPVPTEPEPVLQEDGGNLSAVLMWLNRKHQSAWEELESHLRSAVPGFRSLNVEPRGGPGTVIGVWNEAGVRGELTLADLSDGTLRFLCGAVLCLSPNLPSLLCIDEPELGLHPRVLPVLSGLLRLASARTQILIATHSPYFLSHFTLDDIGVMRKEEGAARFVRPATSKALREMVAEVGGEALTRLHISDELETLP